MLLSLLSFNFTQFVILENLSILDLALPGGKRVEYFFGRVDSFLDFYTCPIEKKNEKGFIQVLSTLSWSVKSIQALQLFTIATWK